ncbi:hypothetical protein MPTK1_6g01690 [Marchantia polymorpha subsp. ruderalis]|uniref:Uncharacterized protein n=2 Tax=Marchantia polymorpha TaxID=3197 RepID=A0AAF6BMH7_MARPO|nr:hypothetical protein MARPO_0052s0035 [Marchantia polymorpha]BBN13211.1 hypothetical protein Mp_6g01690 [Marchantia polymorpha subsp. ruderalis]|eukprot:PTQ38234.1 hypothetical protein MARPO_0052s0035 [Marchantia polymorpha]
MSEAVEKKGKLLFVQYGWTSVWVKDAKAAWWSAPTPLPAHPRQSPVTCRRSSASSSSCRNIRRFGSQHAKSTTERGGRKGRNERRE